jgi:hypothetical protein
LLIEKLSTNTKNMDRLKAIAPGRVRNLVNTLVALVLLWCLWLYASILHPSAQLITIGLIAVIFLLQVKPISKLSTIALRGYTILLIFIALYFISGALVHALAPDMGWTTDSFGNRQRVMDMTWLYAMLTAGLLTVPAAIFYFRSMPKTARFATTFLLLDLLVVVIAYVITAP